MTSATRNNDLYSLLRCPRTRAPLTRDGAKLTCTESGFEGGIVDDVAVMMLATRRSFFDDKFEVMREGHKAEGERRFCYEQQMELLESYLEPGMIALDIGCGPSLPYRKPAGVRIIGLEPSFQSIKANTECDLRVYGSAYNIPLPDRSVDLVICIYSIHHMVGATIEETHNNVRRAFTEFGRVLKPDGRLFVFEMTPLSPFAAAQDMGWNLVRRLFPHVLDMYFWTAAAIIDLGRRTLPAGSQVEKVFFGTSIFTCFPPAFNLPWLRVPRLIYPLDPKLYQWRMPRDPA